MTKIQHIWHMGDRRSIPKNPMYPRVDPYDPRVDPKINGASSMGSNKSNQHRFFHKPNRAGLHLWFSANCVATPVVTQSWRRNGGNGGITKNGNGVFAIDVHVTGSASFMDGWEAHSANSGVAAAVTSSSEGNVHHKLTASLIHTSFANFMFQTWRSKKARCYSRKAYIKISRQVQIQGYTRYIRHTVTYLYFHLYR